MITRKCPRKITISRIMRRLMSNYERIKDHKMSHKNITFHEKIISSRDKILLISIFWAKTNRKIAKLANFDKKNVILKFKKWANLGQFGPKNHFARKNEFRLTNIVIGLARKEFESVRRWVCVLEENRVLLFLFWFVTINQPLSLWCITIPKKMLTF